MGNSPCKICRYSYEKELEIEQDKKEGNLIKENTPRLEYSKNILYHRKNEIQNFPNNYENTIIKNLELEKIKCQLSDRKSENILNDDEDFSENDSEHSEILFREDKIYIEDQKINSPDSKKSKITNLIYSRRSKP